MTVFEKVTAENTVPTLKMAAERAKQDGVHLVVASTGGDTALKAVQSRGVQKMAPETLQMLKELGVPVVRTTHVLSGAERGISTKMGGAYPVEIIAHALRMLSQGVKVCVECAVMALDCEEIPYGEAVVAVGGTGHGADTACVLTPAGANAILECKIHEILCKPY